MYAGRRILKNEHKSLYKDSLRFIPVNGPGMLMFVPSAYFTGFLETLEVRANPINFLGWSAVCSGSQEYLLAAL